jgi:hypothetical protein
MGWRTVFVAGLLAATAAGAQQPGCNCFPPELQAKTAIETLQKATLVAYGRLGALQPDGSVRLEVLESFKGPAAGASVQLAACAGAEAHLPGDDRLLIAFEAPPTRCDLHPREHYLLGALRGLPR